MLYYRYTDKNNPMSDWGHAIFAANQDKVINYGNNGYTLDGSITVDIYDLKELIISEFTDWQEANKENNWDDIYYFAHKITPEKFFKSFAPADIVSCAEAYDHDFYITWLWENICLPYNIMAIHTPDGAVCFNESIINKIN